MRQWEDRIKPTLDQEEQREPFDIHVYGHRILHNFPRSAQEAAVTGRAAAANAAAEPEVLDDAALDAPDAPLPFATLVHAPEKFQICRMFLATLQLVGWQEHRENAKE